MHRPEIRKINSKIFVRHFGQEIKFVTQDHGHLWLHFRGKPRAVIIPMQDEAILNDIQGRSFEDIMHKAQTRAARMVRAAYRESAYRSELVDDSDREIRPFHMTDAEWEANKRYWFNKDDTTQWPP